MHFANINKHSIQTITNQASLTKMLAKSVLKKPQKGTLNEYYRYPPLLENSCYIPALLRKTYTNI